MKLVVSIMPRSLEEAQQLDSSRYEDADVIEWRADFLEKSEILTVAPAVFEKFAGREILFTLRTRAEGGGMELTNEEYVGIHLKSKKFIDSLGDWGEILKNKESK